MHKKFPNKRLAEELDAYDAAGLAPSSHPPSELQALVRNVNKVLCSDFPRAIESAMYLQMETEIIRSSLFREAPLPRHIPIPFHLNAKMWAIIARTLWFLGYAGGAESHKHSRQRAHNATQHLIEHAKNVGTVALVGHGIMNLFIAKQLVKQSWQGPRKQNTDYWGWSIYQCP